MAGIKFDARAFLRLVLVSLIIAVVVLGYVYYLVSRPPAQVVNSRYLTHVLSIYGYGATADEQLKEPHDVAFDSSGNVYVTDAGHRRVLVFDGRGRFIRRIGEPGTGPGQFVTPLGIAVGPDGRVYVADESAGKVVIFNAQGKLVREIRMMMPLKPAVFGRRLYVANYGYVNMYDLSGRYLIDRFGGKGRAEGKFDLPTGLTVAGKDKIYVADTNNLRVQALDGRGKVKWVRGTPYTPDNVDRRFGLPAGIVADESDRLFVIDAFSHQIEVLRADDGKHLASIGEEGPKEGQLYYPGGIAYGGQGLFAVADKFNNRVQLLRIRIP